MKLKSYCEDLSEGKFGYPVIHAITTQPNDTRILGKYFYLQFKIDSKTILISFMYEQI